MAGMTYFEAWEYAIEYALARGYTMVEGDIYHMVSPKGTRVYHIDELITALVRKGLIWAGWY